MNCIVDKYDASVAERVSTIARRLGLSTYLIDSTNRPGIYLVGSDGAGVDLVDILWELTSELNSMAEYTGYTTIRKWVDNLAKTRGERRRRENLIRAQKGLGKLIDG